MTIFQNPFILLLTAAAFLSGATPSTPQSNLGKNSASLDGAASKPNIILLFADDISAREIPVYGSNVWSPPEGGDTKDMKYRARTPVLDRLATEGCWIKTPWASVKCSPSRAMMMTGRYAHLHKWWHNKDMGTWKNPQGVTEGWPLYASSPHTIAHIAKKGGYGTFWAGKTQMFGDIREYAFDEACFTPGAAHVNVNPYTDFVIERKKKINKDTGEPAGSYPQRSWYWQPHVELMNHPATGKTFEWHPFTPEQKKDYGLNTFGPDLEMEYILDYMERTHNKGQPFFIYHTSHLGHDAFDWLDPSRNTIWPETPKINWDNGRYTRSEPKITGDKGVYKGLETVTEPGMHSHVNYLDYQVWQYMEKLKELKIENNTVFIFCADNGTFRYGKGSSDRQKGAHVPLIIYAPGLGQTKKGGQDVLVNLSDMLPTIADIAGVIIPGTYEHNGESWWEWLTTEKKQHRGWLYAYRYEETLIRGSLVMKDGNNRWWNVEEIPGDLISFPQITDWSKVSEAHRMERDKLKGILTKYDKHATEHDPPNNGEIPKVDPLILDSNYVGAGYPEDTIKPGQYLLHRSSGNLIIRHPARGESQYFIYNARGEIEYAGTVTGIMSSQGIVQIPLRHLKTGFHVISLETTAGDVYLKFTL